MRENSILKPRILQFLESKKLNKADFYRETGASNGILTQKNGISEDNLLRFLNFYNDINIEWLFTGKGEMLKSEKEKHINTEKYIALLEKDNKRLENENATLKEENERLSRENVALKNSKKDRKVG